jgi:hypothetical protein
MAFLPQSLPPPGSSPALLVSVAVRLLTNALPVPLVASSARRTTSLGVACARAFNVLQTTICAKLRVPRLAPALPKLLRDILKERAIFANGPSRPPVLEAVWQMLTMVSCLACSCSCYHLRNISRLRNADGSPPIVPARVQSRTQHASEPTTTGERVERAQRKRVSAQAESDLKIDSWFGLYAAIRDGRIKVTLHNVAQTFFLLVASAGIRLSQALSMVFDF